MPLKPPKFMPETPPILTWSTDPLEYRPVPGVTFHEEGDGIIYYYDQPLVYVAWFQDRCVVVTITDEDFAGPPKATVGWKQYWAIPVDHAFLLRVYNSELTFRALYEQPGVEPYFIHEDWARVRNGWTHEYRVFSGLAFPDSAKPVVGLYLDPGKRDTP